MSPQQFKDLVDAALDQRRELNQFRERRPLRVLDATHIQIEGKTYVNFASNNYLGLTHHPAILRAITSAAAARGFGSGSAPLVTGHTEAHQAAERDIARWKGTEDALLLPSGYQANQLAVQTLSELAPGRVRFLIDKLAHASLIDAVRATGAEFRVFPHHGLEKLERLLAAGESGSNETAAGSRLDVVITESIFSMDGDAADLAGLSRLKLRHPFVLLLDEAHGSGVYGPRGSGYAAEMDLQDIVDVTIVTLSKALGGIGGAVCGTAKFCSAMVNLGRAYLFSTSPPAIIAAAASAAIQVLEEEPDRQRRMRELAKKVRLAAQAAGFEMPAGDAPIVPIILGSEQAALDASQAWRDRGLIVPAIRPPTVPRGQSRLRVTLSSQHTDREVMTLIKAIRSLKPRPGRRTTSTARQRLSPI